MGNNSTWMRSRPWPTSWAPNAFPVGLTVLFLLGVVFCAFAPAFVYVIFAVAAHAIDPRKPNEIPAVQLLIAQLVTYVPQGLYLLYLLPPLAHRSLAGLGLRAPGRRELGYGLAGLLVMFLVVNGVADAVAAITHRHDTEAAVALLEQMKTAPEKALFIFVAVVCAPLIEELTFRVFLFNALQRYFPVALAAIASGAVFGIVHMSPFGWPQLLTVALPLACGGVVLAYTYAKARSYWSNVIAHAGFNLINVLLLFVTHGKS